MRRPPEQRLTRKGFTLIELMVVIAIIAILSSILLPNFVKARSQGRLAGCKTNLRNLASAIESYSADNANRYPSSLNVLTPGHISIIPTCPSAGKNAPYLNSYAARSNPDGYSLMCGGSHHGELNLPDNYPQFIPAIGGLVERPP
ncbi:MAG: prepilin-type N-terminal cleavage/methylation domain-containing protein [Armatimonadetes bacterium]|nr:prepilin-type N-terminal cleavage/methylation domain-containing protein [Armatimonadota bacterium]